MTQNQPDRLDRIEALLADTADLVVAHNEVLTRLEGTVTRHDEALTRIESAIAQLTTSTNQAITLASENSRQIAVANQRIQEILEYLYAERPNGRGNGDIG